MQRLADQGLASAYDVGERFWIDVDDVIAFERAEREEARKLEPASPRGADAQDSAG